MSGCQAEEDANLLCYVVEVVIKIRELLVSSLEQGTHIQISKPLCSAVEFAA